MAKKHHHGGLVAGIAAVAVLGAYFLYGQDGAKRRAKVKGWMLKAKGEVLEKVERMKNVNRATYEKVVDEVVGRYRKLKSTDLSDTKKLAADLKKHWKNIERELKTATGQTKKVAKSQVRKVKKNLKK